jgi:hypothetical protein
MGSTKTLKFSIKIRSKNLIDKEKIQMNHAELSDEITPAARAEKLGEVALRMGLVRSFVVRHFQG